MHLSTRFTVAVIAACLATGAPARPARHPPRRQVPALCALPARPKPEASLGLSRGIGGGLSVQMKKVLLTGVLRYLTQHRNARFYGMHAIRAYGLTGVIP